MSHHSQQTREVHEHHGHDATPRLELEWSGAAGEELDLLVWAQLKHMNTAAPGRGVRTLVTLGSWAGFVAGPGLMWHGISSGLHAFTALGAALLFIALMLGARTVVWKQISHAALLKRMRKSVEDGTVESSEGTWFFTVAHGRYGWHHAEPGHTTSAPAAEITDLMLYGDRVALFCGTHLRGSIPVRAFNGVDPLAALRDALDLPRATPPTRPEKSIPAASRDPEFEQHG